MEKVTIEVREGFIVKVMLHELEKVIYLRDKKEDN